MELNEIKLFNSEEFGSIRMVMLDDKPYFCGRDVATALGYERPADAIRKHCKGVAEMETPSNGGVQKMKFIPESDVYRLAFGSKLPTAEKFTDWVTEEVLPTIRKTGSYSKMDSYQIEDPIERAKRWIEEQQGRKQLEVKVSALTVDNQIMKPKADYFDELVDRNLLTNIRDTAKELGIEQNQFVAFLLDKKYMYRDKKGKLLPYAKHTEDGVFELKEFTNEKTGFSSTQALITPKGRETFRLLCISEHIR